MGGGLGANILRIIPEVVSGTFLLVSLNMDAILAEATVHKMINAIVRINPAGHRSCGRGHEGVMRLLLGQEYINPDAPDTVFDQTPLSWAAMDRYGGDSGATVGREDVNQ